MFKVMITECGRGRRTRKFLTYATRRSAVLYSLLVIYLMTKVCLFNPVYHSEGSWYIQFAILSCKSVEGEQV